ncbi:LOW QUALITY PROTEIN: piggyBac transposable element-derived protein 4-like [Vespula maculifrons]|uniref:PiggyBac transposable element-derived protein 4-like n=1 Tax=Vespula maculifrons TaxID=7453 RepID=A0ABD2AQX5_VESMC
MSNQICSVRKILEDIQNISEECSERRNFESENKQIESEDDLFDIEEVESNETLSLKINKLKVRIIYSTLQKLKSENKQIESEDDLFDIEEVESPTTYAKRNIISGKTKTAFSVIIDNNIISYTKNVREQSGIQRLKTDKLLLLFQMFIKNSQNNYKSDMNLTVDEQLFSAKIEVYAVHTKKYNLNGFLYLGRKETSIPFGESVTLKLRHVTIDNFFMSTSLATKLLEKQTTLVGTMRSNRRELLNLRKINQRQNETFVDNYL